MDTHVIGMGMVASLGLDVATAAAAARAGLTRPRELDYFLVRSADDPSHQGVVAHEIPDLTHGFEGSARMLRIMQATLIDLRRQTADAPFDPKRSAFYLSLPDPDRAAPATAGEGAASSSGRNPDESRVRGERLMRSAARAAGWPGGSTVAFVSTRGHTGVAEALVRALADLQSGRIETAIVGGVDSLLEERTLAWLDRADRLKSPRIATGVPPGEAGALIVLCSTPTVATHLATIRAVSVAAEEHPRFSGEPSHGAGLAEAIAGVAEAAAWGRSASTWIVSDHNGEPYRAREWGHAIVRLLARWPAFANPLLWYPAASFGDTAGVSGAVALCLVARAFVRGYAPNDQAIITSSADGPGRSAVLVERPRNNAR